METSPGCLIRDEEPGDDYWDFDEQPDRGCMMIDDEGEGMGEDDE